MAEGVISISIRLGEGIFVAFVARADTTISICITFWVISISIRLTISIIRGGSGSVSLNTEEARTVTISGAVNIIDTLGTLLETTVLLVASKNI